MWLKCLLGVINLLVLSNGVVSAAENTFSEIFVASVPFKLECHPYVTSSDVLPLTAIKWKKNGVLLDLKSTGGRISDESTANNNSSLLLFNDPIASDAGEYQCITTHSFGVSISKIISVQEAKIGDFQDTETVDLSADGKSTLKIECNAPESIPAAKVQWLRINSKGTETVIQKTDFLTIDPDNSLLFRTVLHNDATDAPNDEYACSAFNSVLKKVVYGPRIRLHVTSENRPVSPVKLFVSPEKQTFFDRSDNRIVELNCIFGGHPLPTVTWFLNGTELEKHDWHYFLTNSSLQADIDHMGVGQYKCVASNGIGADMSHTMDVTIHEELAFNEIQKEIKADEGTSGTILCSARGYPKPVIEIFCNGSSISNLPQNDRWSVTEHGLEIMDVQASDQGIFGCKISNIHEFKYKEIIFTVAG